MHAAFVVLLLWAGLACATWFPEMEMSQSEWDKSLAPFDPASSYKTCTNEGKGGGGSRFMTLWKDKPTSIILTGKGTGKMDVKFKDSLYVFDHPIDLSDEYPCLVIPPYQPVEWMMIDSSASINVCAYSSTVEGEDNNDNPKAKGCDCADVMSKSPKPKCKAVGIPRTIKTGARIFLDCRTYSQI